MQREVVAWSTALGAALFPFVSFWNHNKDSGVDPERLLAYSLVLLLPAMAVVGAARWRRGADGAQRAAVVVLAAVLALLAFPWLSGVLSGLGLADRWHPVVWAVLLPAALAGAGLAARASAVRVFAAIGAVILVGVPMAEIAWERLTTQQAESNAAPEEASGPVAPASDDLPNVYFFVPDGYARGDALEAYFDHDNSDFEEALGRQGFHIADEAAANYPATFLSLASAFEMDYLAETEDGTRARHGDYLGYIRGDSRAVRELRALGYQYVHAPPGSWEGSRCSGIEDVCVEPLQPSNAVAALGEMEWALLDLTPAGAALRQWALDGADGDALGGPYNEPDQIVETVLEDQPDEPYFVFAHVMTPHPPYRYRSNCRLRETVEEGLDEWGENFRDEEFVHADDYIEALECANRQYLRAAELLADADPGAIVVVMSDHGPGFTVEWGRDVDDWTDRQIAERFPILHATRLPESCGDPPTDLSPVNTFRVILGCVEGEEPDLLPNRHFVVTYRSMGIGELDQLPDPQ